MSNYKCACPLASGRKKTEDRAQIIEHGDYVVVVMGDGAGGIRGGAAANDALALEVTTAPARNAFVAEDGSGWNTIFSDIDAMLAEKMTGETTGVVVVVTPRIMLGVSAGDSEAWVIGSKYIDELTAGQSKKRLGSGRAAPVFFSRPSLEGTLIVGTDGLFNYASRETIAEAVHGREPADAAERLRALVQLPSGDYADDVAAVVVRPADQD
jgi:serine/threonine protein phosphatase PrpC